MTKDEYMKAVAAEADKAQPGPPPTKVCCASCENLTPEGMCSVHLEYPPLEFIGVENDCEFYEEKIPF